MLIELHTASCCWMSTINIEVSPHSESGPLQRQPISPGYFVFGLFFSTTGRIFATVEVVYFFKMCGRYRHISNRVDVSSSASLPRRRAALAQTIGEWGGYTPPVPSEIFTW